MFDLYAAPGSGNCFKPFLALRQLRIPVTLRMVDVLAGETKSPEFLAINPVGVVPYLRAPGGLGLSESNAMLWYIAEGSSLMPSEAFARAKGLQWSFFEQSRLEPFISPARFLTFIAPERGSGRERDIAQWQSRAHEGLAILDAYLQSHDFIAGAHYSIADISVFGYVHVAPQGGIDLDAFQAVRSWIERVRATPDFATIDEMTSLLRGTRACEGTGSGAKVA
ncbi:glutathione S-transferase family protein [Lichenihabitans sp. Uapishka_5]|uniref:glutathione S-transferase family protein n=1 Tax=Lichenihabitans sp. Uapishka_5 TaxID=3037302 RepID=UPI0029E7DEF1|nr:glutathione S-transferase family protein [Lichenihabitans sp. Uapishka_5]MDX7949573.1 glutathione S-transferase family protein [Lichenihabitans sp. Uapishka_5]